MDIKVEKVKQYNSTYKNVLMVDGKPICIVAGDKKTSECIQYLSGYNADINDGKIKKILKNTKKENSRESQNKNGCFCCLEHTYIYCEDEDNNAHINGEGIMTAEIEGETISFKVKFCPNCGRKF